MWTKAYGNIREVAKGLVCSFVLSLFETVPDEQKKRQKLDEKRYIFAKLHG